MLDRASRVEILSKWDNNPVAQSRHLMRRIKSVTGLSVHRRHVPSLISASESIDAIYRRDRKDIGENERGEGDGNDPGTRRETGRPRVHGTNGGNGDTERLSGERRKEEAEEEAEFTSGVYGQGEQSGWR